MKTTTIVFLIFLTAPAQAQSTKKEIVKEIITEANKVGVDADLALAIATVESSLNPKAVGGLGEQGLYQLRPEFHKLTGGTKNNIKVGITYLKWLKQKDKGVNGNAWFVRYNYGPYRTLKDPQNSNYYKKVMHEISNLKTKRYILAEN